MDRRTFLRAATTCFVILLSACGGGGKASRIYGLKSSTPLRLVRGFRRQQAALARRVIFTTDASLRDLFRRLQQWRAPDQRSSSIVVRLLQRLGLLEAEVPATWLTLGDAWLEEAIAQELIQPFQLPSDVPLSPPWQQLGQGAKAEPEGRLWGVPYRWGSLLMAYNPQHFKAWGWQPTSWSDLLRPELAQRILLPQPATVVVGLALKALGQPLGALPGASSQGGQDLEGFLKQLIAQALGYSSDHYLEPLVIEDASLVVGWSTDILPFLQQYRQFAVAVPEEGTLITTDLWVQPQGAAVDEGDFDWVRYWLQPDVALELTQKTQTCSPRYWSQSDQALPAALRQQPWLTLTPDVAQGSDFPAQLTPEQQATYAALWQRLLGEAAGAG